jgi:hypothetical protein
MGERPVGPRATHAPRYQPLRLVDLADWLTLTNYTNLPATSIQYTDPLAPGSSGRFYRAVWTP